MSIQIKDLGAAVLATEYAVRGPIVERAQELEKQGREIIYCNIGNPQSLGQKPITWLRQLLALCEYPALMEMAGGVFPADAIDTARAILNGIRHGTASDYHLDAGIEPRQYLRLRQYDHLDGSRYPGLAHELFHHRHGTVP